MNKEKQYWSIYDHDIKEYLLVGRNSKDKKSCLTDYLYYRRDDLKNWEHCNKEIAPNFNKKYWSDEIQQKLRAENILDSEKDQLIDELFELFCKDVSEKYIIDDMDMCNFELINHDDEIIYFED